MIKFNNIESKLLNQLMELGKKYVTSLPPNFEIASALYTLEVFEKQELHGYMEYYKNIVNSSCFRESKKLEYGMNSPGILWDRLTILNCKYLFTAPDSIHHNPVFHKDLGNVKSELEGVMRVLIKSHPAKNILLAKEATNRQHVIIPLGESTWALQMSNIAMWINQDLLYTVSAEDVDPQRLRDYITFFSKANRIRNTAIESIELFYSQQMQRN